ncbi:hypothetical protein ACOSP7_000037 [Xanthoceras sorbifolium]|uniref:Gamma-glutamylcyclotransferase family protein n=1 Tax=Xanthoceras sorbifolium TaxID=99658 RepID=A0ABQ8IPK8_9ROSI|nr:hypothetical protein JRO89_XS01G0407100 [Xanthoceras sorbifolium]
MQAMADNSESNRTLIFTYGTLKHGFLNHNLMQDLIRQDDAFYLGPFISQQPYPLVCGLHGIPYLINLVGSGNRVKGELYSVSTQGLVRLDELEGTSIGHYDRLPIKVESEDGGVLKDGEAYFANSSFGERLWEKKGKVGMSEYSEREGKKYVRIEDRVIKSMTGSYVDDIASFLSS